MKKNGHLPPVQAGNQKRYGPALIPRFAGLTVFIAALAGFVTVTLLTAVMRGVLQAHILNPNAPLILLTVAFIGEYMMDAQSSVLHPGSRRTLKNAAIVADRAEAELITDECKDIKGIFDNAAVCTADGVGWASGTRSRAEYPCTAISPVLGRRIIERSGGRIWAGSEPGEGATSHFAFPGA